MERLQAAIEKAREQRQKRGQPRLTLEEPVVVPGTDGAWESLSPADISPDIIQKSRLVAAVSGPEAGPYDMLRTRILQQVHKEGWRRIAIVSPHAACGKSTTVANLAFSFGRQSELHTMIFDLDLRRTGLGRILGQRCEHNMADVFENRVTFDQHGRRLGANVALGLNSGPAKNPAELLQSQATRDALADIEKTYTPDLLLFDMPPLMSGDDNFGFLQNVDAALILVEAEKTPVEEIDIAERQVAELTQVMGIVLNKCRYSHESAYGYNYDYS